MSFFSKTSAPPSPPPPSVPEGPLAEFVTVSIPGEHFNWRLKPDKALDTFLDAVIAFMQDIDLGEIAIVESVPGAAMIYLDAPNAEQFAAKLVPWLERQAFATGARVSIDVDINEDGRVPRELVLNKTDTAAKE